MVIQISTRIEGVDKTLRELRKKIGILRSKRAILPLRMKWGVYQLNQFRRNFIKEGAATGGWKKITPVTALLRAGISQKISSFEQAEAIATSAKPLQDTGRLRDSFVPGRSKNVMKHLTSLSVEVGTNVDYAEKLHTGGSVRFTFDKETRRRFMRSVPKKIGRQINKFHFTMLRHFEKKDGTSVDLPARPIVYPPTSVDRKRLEKITSSFLIKIIRGKL